MTHFTLKRRLYQWIAIMLVLFCLYSLLHYFSFRTITYLRAEATAKQMLEQVAQNVSQMTERLTSSAQRLSFNQSVQELLVSEDRVKSIELYDHVSEIVGVAKSSNSVIYSIAWVGDNLRRISDPVRSENEVVDRLYETYDFTSEDFRKPVFSSIIEVSNDSQYYFGYVFPVYSLTKTYYEKIGAGVFVLDIRELEKLVNISAITKHSVFAILDQNNTVVVCNQDLTTGEIYEDLFWEHEKDADTDENGIVSTLHRYRGMDSIMQSAKIEENGWRVVSIVPLQDLTGDLQTLLQIGLILVALGVLVLSLWGRVIIRDISRPIDAIVTFLRRAKEDSFDQRMEPPAVDEFAIISSNINALLNRVDEMTTRAVDNQKKLYEAQLAEQNAKLLALQSQINPHFLYNTLNCLSNIGLAYNIPEVADISVAMSNIYRYSIKGDKIVTLREELQCIREYMRIMDIRFGGKFETVYAFEDEILSLYTLRMILQPIVENAVNHGMAQRNGKGRLTLRSSISEDHQLVLTVHNDGKAMRPEELRTLRQMILEYERTDVISSKGSIGLSNINKRIKIQFGAQYGMQIESSEGSGTQVTLKLPVLHEPTDSFSSSPTTPVRSC